MRSATLLMVFMLFFGGISTAQSQHIPYQTWIEKAEIATDKGLHLEAAWAYGRAFASGPGGDDPYFDRLQAAISWTKASRPDSAIAQLRYLAQHTGYQGFADLEMNPEFDVLHAHNGWKPVLDQIRRNRYISDPASDTATAGRLARVLVMDQRLRSQLSGFLNTKYKSAAQMALMDSIRRADSANLTFVDSLLQHSGWLDARQIGRSGVGTVFIVLQHSDSATQVRYLPMLREATASGKLPASDLAMIEDRVALLAGEEQLYGTQLKCDALRCWVDRLKDPLHVDERRKAVGLEPLAEYLQYWNISWDPVEYERSRNAERAK